MRANWALLSAIVTCASGALVPKAFNSLPLGQVLPAGWLHDQLMVQTNGLAGHEMEFYNYVAQTDWMGGPSFYSNLEEAGSYWFNGMVANGVLVNSSKINQQTSAFLSYVLAHQQSDGWIGPETGSKPRFLWGRYPFFFGAIQMVEANPSLTNQVVSAMMKFVSLSNTMLKNKQGIEPWMQTRWADYVMTLEWLYEFHTAASDTASQNLLLETMQLIQDNGDDWIGVFQEQHFPKIPTEQIGPSPFGVLTWHGVNIAEGLKAGASAYRHTKNATQLAASVDGWDLLFQYHGRPSGVFAADEYLAGLEAVRGTELCIVVETMFSGSYLYQVSGNPKFADRVERITYNALPAEMTGDMWSRQYLQQQNQIASQNMNPNPFPNDGSYSNVFGLEPNYPCCTVNHPQGWPKFVSNSFVTTPDGSGLVHLYMGPFSTSVTLTGGNAVQVSVDTKYPFSDTLTTTINAQKAFTYHVRIPSWVSGGTMSINGGSSQSVKADSNGLQSINVPAGKTTVVLNLPAPITTESRPHGSIAVHRGPLHYAFDIPRNSTVLATNAQQPMAKDFQFEATAAWNYAIDPTTLKFNQGSTSGNLPSPIFDSHLPPVSISVTACPITWNTSGSLVATSPPQNPKCTGAQQTITLTPYGSTKLRISEFPTFKAT